jgi:hypothetical protein
LKEGIRNSITLFFPDYSLVWVLRTDASDIACGAVLYQVYITSNGEKVNQLIGVESHKFSGSARHWDIPKKEAYAHFLDFQSFHITYELKNLFFKRITQTWCGLVPTIRLL